MTYKYRLYMTIYCCFGIAYQKEMFSMFKGIKFRNTKEIMGNTGVFNFRNEWLSCCKRKKERCLY